MKAHEFKKQMNEEFDAFMKEWEEGMRTKPHQYPEELGEGSSTVHKNIEKFGNN